jgi:hypothetical protein
MSFGADVFFGNSFAIGYWVSQFKTNGGIRANVNDSS